MHELEQAARELIMEFGGMGVYTAYSPGPYNAATSSASPIAVAQPVPMVLVDLTLQSNGLSAKFGTQVIAGDKEAYVIPPHKYISGATEVPVTPNADKVTFAGVTYSVVSFKDANPSGGDSWVWYLYLRR